MKKLIALLLSLMLIVGCAAALAETEAAPAPAAEATPASFDVKMDKIPAGYAFEYSYSDDGWLQGTFTAVADETAAIVYFAIGELDEDYTLDADLTQAELDEIAVLISEEYAKPVVSQKTTTHGTRVVIIEEAEDPYYADFCTAWHGYAIQVGLLKSTAITEEDKDLAMTILSDMWVVNE